MNTDDGQGSIILMEECSGLPEEHIFAGRDGLTCGKCFGLKKRTTT